LAFAQPASSRISTLILDDVNLAQIVCLVFGQFILAIPKSPPNSAAGRFGMASSFFLSGVPRLSGGG
jgi:hypothetical protein